MFLETHKHLHSKRNKDDHDNNNNKGKVVGELHRVKNVLVLIIFLRYAVKHTRHWRRCQQKVLWICEK